MTIDPEDFMSLTIDPKTGLLTGCHIYRKNQYPQSLDLQYQCTPDGAFFTGVPGSVGTSTAANKAFVYADIIGHMLRVDEESITINGQTVDVDQARFTLLAASKGEYKLVQMLTEGAITRQGDTVLDDKRLKNLHAWESYPQFDQALAKAYDNKAISKGESDLLFAALATAHPTPQDAQKLLDAMNQVKDRGTLAPPVAATPPATSQPLTPSRPATARPPVQTAPTPAPQSTVLDDGDLIPDAQRLDEDDLSADGSALVQEAPQRPGASTLTKELAANFGGVGSAEYRKITTMMQENPLFSAAVNQAIATNGIDKNEAKGLSGIASLHFDHHLSSSAPQIQTQLNQFIAEDKQKGTVTR